MTPRLEAGMPLYRQIGSALWDQIQSGELHPGEQMPTEIGLSEMFGVNRLTVRQAIVELQRLGAVEIRRGIGTFVTAPPDLVEVVVSVPKREQHTDSTHDALTDPSGVVSGAPLRRVDEIIDAIGPATGMQGVEAAAHLSVPLESLLRLDTVMMREGEPWIANSYWFDSSLAQVAELTRELGTVVEAFTTGLGLALSYRWRAFSAVGADYDEVRLLGIAAGTALLIRDGVSASSDGAVSFYVRRRIRGDNTRFVLRYEEHNVRES